MQAKQGNRVKVHYTLKDAGGNVVETSKDIYPLEFTIGEGKMIPGFEDGVIGMKQDENKTISIAPENAYGLRDEKKVFEFERKNAPSDFDPRVGDTVKMHRSDGKAVAVTVLSVTEKGFMMDANHPLAGKELIFDLELVEIVK
ncbi:MAG: peptidylprolyl isomerase [Nitrospirae bacterium]|nr:peptidylprolyl isomerase [Nitrospirota bacterium]